MGSGRSRVAGGPLVQGVRPEATCRSPVELRHCTALTLRRRLDKAADGSCHKPPLPQGVVWRGLLLNPAHPDQLGGEVGDVLVEFLGRAAVIRFAVIVLPLVAPLMRTVLPTGNCCAVPGVFLVPNCV